MCHTIHGYHKARGVTFKLISPYTLLVDEEDEIHLLDLGAPSNEDIKELIDNKVTRNSFTYLGVKYYRNKYYADYYSFAKTIQFILSQAQIEPPLSKKEMKQLNKMVKQCIKVTKKKSYKSMKDLSRVIDEISQRTNPCAWYTNRLSYMVMLVLVYVIFN